MPSRLLNLFRSALRNGSPPLWRNDATLHQNNLMTCSNNPSSEAGRPYTIVVEGNIGSGKTTFLNNIRKSSAFGPGQLEVLDEPVSEWRNMKGHNLLHLMYKDPQRYSLLFQTYVQLTMLKQHTRTPKAPVRIMERSLLSARYCFVENLYNENKMSDAEYCVISEWFNFLVTCPNLDFNVDLIVYLRTSPEVAFERIMERNRSEEENLIPFEYIKNLHELHEDWLGRKTKYQPLPAPVVIINADDDMAAMVQNYHDHESTIFRNSPLFINN